MPPDSLREFSGRNRAEFNDIALLLWTRLEWRLRKLGVEHLSAAFRISRSCPLPIVVLAAPKVARTML